MCGEKQAKDEEPKRKVESTREREVCVYVMDF